MESGSPASAAQPGRITDLAAWRLAWAGFIAIALCYAGSVGVSIATHSVDPFFVFTMAFPLVGILILTRQPTNTIGWILLAVGVVGAVNVVLSGYGWYRPRLPPGAIPAAHVPPAPAGPPWAPLLGTTC